MVESNHVLTNFVFDNIMLCKHTHTHKGQWQGALMSSLICAWINGWVNDPEAGYLRRYRARHCNVHFIFFVTTAQLSCFGSDLNTQFIGILDEQKLRWKYRWLCKPPRLYTYNLANVFKGNRALQTIIVLKKWQIRPRPLRVCVNILAAAERECQNPPPPLRNRPRSAPAPQPPRACVNVTYRYCFIGYC